MGATSLEMRGRLSQVISESRVGFDSMCSRSIFGSESLLTDIVDTPPVNFKGVGGELTATKKGTHADFGEVFYIPGAPNLLSVGELEDRDDVDIDYSKRDKAFYLTCGQGQTVYKFEKIARVYVCDLREYGSLANIEVANVLVQLHTTLAELGLSPELQPQVALDLESETQSDDVSLLGGNVETVISNEKLYTQSEVQAARRVMEWGASMGYISKSNALAMLRGNKVEGADFTALDVERAYDIYGKDLPAVRGKSVRFKRRAIDKRGRPMGKIVNADVTMHSDIMFLCGVKFLVAYVTPLMLIMVQWLKTKSIQCVRQAIDSLRGKLTSKGYKVVEVTADGEGAIGAIKEELRARAAQ